MAEIFYSPKLLKKGPVVGSCKIKILWKPEHARDWSECYLGYFKTIFGVCSMMVTRYENSEPVRELIECEEIEDLLKL